MRRNMQNEMLVHLKGPDNDKHPTLVLVTTHAYLYMKYNGESLRSIELP
jgi:hypothetical protein